MQRTMTEQIPIVFSANDYYVPYMSVMIASILEHADEARNYEIIVLHSNISKAYQEMLRKQVSPYAGFSLRFLEVPDSISKANLYIANANNIPFSKETYYRLIMPYLLPQHDKAIYLDGDMAALTDIGRLWDIPLNDHYIAAVRDYCGISDMYDPNSDRMVYMKEVLGLRVPDDYYIGGLLIMNLKQFREHFSMEEMLEIAAAREWRFHDQDILNVLTQGKTLLLDSRWNVVQDYGKHHFMPDWLYRDWESSAADPYVIHYGGAYKPWNSPKVPYREFFWRYAKKSPFYGVIRKRKFSELHASPKVWLKYWSQYLFPLQSRSREALKKLAATLWK